MVRNQTSSINTYNMSASKNNRIFKKLLFQDDSGQQYNYLNWSINEI